MPWPSAQAPAAKDPSPTLPAPVEKLRGLAERAAAALARYDDVEAIALLGSVARGDARADSDVDLMVVTQGEVRRSHLLRRLPPSTRDSCLSLLAYTSLRLQAEAESGSLFLNHVRSEGTSLHDPHGILVRALEQVAQTAPDVESDIKRRMGQLRLYRDLDRLNGQHLSALSHLYAIGKGVAIARCSELDAPTFVKQRALERLGELRPELAHEAETIARLRPFYEATTGRPGEPFPFEPVDVDQQVKRAIGAIEHIARG